MTWWWIVALAVGIIWTAAGAAMTSLTLTFKNGFMGGSGPGWGGVALMAAITCVGPALILLAVVYR